MKDSRTFHLSVGAMALCALAAFTLFAGETAAQVAEDGVAKGCPLQASWLSEVDIGARFFTTYFGGATAIEGPMVVEWIVGDPTLFGNFPTAVSLTQGMGSWRSKGHQSYVYTWIGYGLDSAGIPIYAWKGSGTGTFQGCDAIAFDYVLEIFPFPLDPLFGEPVSCLSGFGNKSRIEVEAAACP